MPELKTAAKPVVQGPLTGMKKVPAKKAAAKVPTAAPVKSGTTEPLATGPALSQFPPPSRGEGAPEAPVKKAKPKKVEKSTEPREVLYPDVKAKILMGEKALTAEDAKKILGWETEPAGTTFGDDFLLRDKDGAKVRCNNNIGNRPFDPNLAKTWASEILNGNWKLNGEPMIVGKTGLVLSGQHRQVGLVLAAHEWGQNPDRWEKWGKEPTMDCLLVLGVEEDDQTVNTIDTGRPRSLSDVLFRTIGLFKNLKKASDRKAVARVMSYSIKMVWSRTGAGSDAFAPNVRTHADSLDFIDRHPRLCQFVEDVWNEDDGKNRRISKYLSPGYAAGLYYLMASSATKSEVYNKSSSPNEAMLDWSLEDRAWDFFVALSSGDASIASIRTAMGILLNSDDTDGEGLSIQERIAILAKAWNLFALKQPITAKGLELKYVTDDETGLKRLAEMPTVGGIDRGNPSDHEAEDASPVEG